jgi:putative transposase
VRKSRFTEEQITMALRQGEAGTPVEEICRKLGVSEATYFRWKKKFGSLGVPEIRELRQLRQENQKLKQLVADLSLDKTILHEALKKNDEASPARSNGDLGAGGLSRERTSSLPVGGRVSLDGSVRERSSSPGSAQEAAPGAGKRSGPIGLPAAPHAAPARRLGGEP